MKNRQVNGFWNGGCAEYLRALRDEENERLTPLRQALKNETDPEIKCGLKEKIKVHPAEAYIDLKRCGHSGPIWSCTNDFRQEIPECPRACCTMDLGSVTTVA